MRKITVSQFLTLDGVMESPEKWNSSYINDEEITNDILETFAANDALLLGKNTYEFFASRWPFRTGKIADWLNNVRKYVVSTTLEKAEWNNSVIIKEIPGENMLVLGSYHLVQQLMKDNLVDEYKLYIYPLVLSKGKRLFETEQKLKLVKARTFSSGAIGAVYRLCE